MDFEPGEILTTYAMPYTVAARHDALKWAKEMLITTTPTPNQLEQMFSLAQRISNFILEGERGL